ncbi:MAG: pitrilysin family protein [Bacteroidota bacterium]
MKYNIYLFLLALTFAHCSPKTGTAPTTGMSDKSGPRVEGPTKPAPADFRSNPPAPGPAPKIQMGTYDYFTMDNGLQVIVVENHKLPRVSIQLFVDAPSILEGEYAGYVQLAGDLMSKGTKSRTKSQLDEEIDFIGATLSTDSDGIFASSLTKHTDKLLDLMTDVLYNPAFPESEFEKLKKQSLSALAQSKEDPNTIARNVASVMRYGKDHPYGEVVTEVSMEKIDLPKVKSYYDTYFKPNISYLVVVGDVVPAEVKQKMQTYFGKWKPSKNIPAPTYPQPTPPEQTSIDFVGKSGAVQSVFNITYPVDLKPGDPDVIPVNVMNTLLGGYFQSRLNDNLRETHAYTYGARSALRNDKLIGFFSANASVRNEVSDSALIQFMYEFDRLRNEMAEPDEVEMVKSVIAGRFSRQLESPQTVARFALNTFRYKLPKDYYANYLERLSTVTPEEVLATAKKYIHPDKAHVVVVGNKGEVADKLNRFDPSGEITYYDTYGNKIDLTTAISTEGMSPQQVMADYIEAIGGADKVKTVKNVKQTYEMEMQGMKIYNNVINAYPDKMSMAISAGGNVMQKQILNGQKGMTEAMGQRQAMEGPNLEAFVYNGRLFNELNPTASNLKTIVKGAELINGKQTVVLETQTASGALIREYYDAESHLKVRTETDIMGNISTMDYKDYKEVSGVLMPHTLVAKGAGMPMTMTMEATSIEVNKELATDAFKVE